MIWQLANGRGLGSVISVNFPKVPVAEADVRLGAQSGLKSDIAQGPETAERGSRQLLALEHDPEKHALGPRPDGWVPVFPRDKREAFARRSCSNKMIERNDDSKKSHPAQGPRPIKCMG
jgi:hypothetical protein